MLITHFLQLCCRKGVIAFYVCERDKLCIYFLSIFNINGINRVNKMFMSKDTDRTKLCGELTDVCQ